jgi:hypothetical protein
MDAYDQDAEDDVLDARAPVSPRRLLALGAIALAISALIIGVATVQPWRHLTAEEDVEPFAGTRAPSTEVRAALASAAESDRRGNDPLDQPEVNQLAIGAFEGRDGQTAVGQARILDLADGRRVVRLEGLELANGPELEVLLSPAPADAPTTELAEGAVSLGPLVYNIGDATYELPPEIDPNAYRSVLVAAPAHEIVFGVAGYR